jgi:hypothetical protein
MPALTLPLLNGDKTLNAALAAVSAARDKPCSTAPEAWLTEKVGLAQRRDEARAKAGCRECRHRALCAAWALEMAEFGVWGGYTQVERARLRTRHRQLVEEFIMLIRSHINTPDGLGGRLRPGTEREVPDEVGALLVRRGFATRLDAVVARMDAAVEKMEPVSVSASAPEPLEWPDHDDETNKDDDAED